MSSPFTIPNYGCPDRATASSPALGSRRTEQTQGSENVSIRPMRLKVLYTFDDQNKTNCLARWPQVIEIRTAYLEDGTQIGVVDLKTCILAIVAASPELVAQLGQDYTVYAYDYSENDTPLVGQGMLSWVLGSPSASSAPGNSARTFVTGRVCKNTMGLFSSGLQETMEVKLRLIPVPSCLQSDYMESMKKYKDLSKIMPLGIDPGAWMSFLQANPAMTQLANQSRCQSPAVGPGQSEGICQDNMQGLLGEGHPPRYSGEQLARSLATSFQNSDAIENHPRPASPAVSIQSANAAPKRRGRPPRNAARLRDALPKHSIGQEQLNMTPSAEGDKFEKGPAKKRAKVSKADWNGTIGLGRQPESLRVAASTAASVRIHQPTARRPLSTNASSLEAPPRAPTPVANLTTDIRRPPHPTGGSTLRRESFTVEDSAYESPYNDSDALPMPPVYSMTSPENSRANTSANTPVDIASSPPVYRGDSTAPSSPKLPNSTQDVDSGFMSGPVDDLFEDDDYQTLDHEGPADTSHHISSELLPVPTLEPYKSCPVAPIADPLRQPDAKAIARSRMAARNASGSRALDRTISTEDIGSTSTTKDTLANQCQPNSGQEPQQQPNSETAVLPPTIEVCRSRSGSGANAKRKQAIQSKLESSVAAGAIPSYCENCGAIETPTWRKAWAKVYQGSPGYIKTSEEDGGIITWQYLDNTNYYRILKRSLLPDDEGFLEILLCNPCGIWLHSRKCMRPKDFWEKEKPPRDDKRKRPARPKKQKNVPPSEQATSDPSHGVNLQSEPPSPGKNNVPLHDQQEGFPLPPQNRQRALSEQILPDKTDGNGKEISRATTAPQREVQSSPAKIVGTMHVPIEIDDPTPKPTRRLLFPSPKQAGGQRQELGNGLKGGKKNVQPSPGAIKLSRQVVEDQADKENCPPLHEDNENLDDLFEDKPGLISRPSTPSPLSKPQSQLFKTPRKIKTPDRNFPSSGDFFSSVAKALLHGITPKRTSTKQPLGPISPFSQQLNQLMSGNMSPSASNFEFPPLPSLRNTPGGRANADFDFSQFDNQDLLSTDVIMPSSPPEWLLYEDPAEEANSLWNRYQIPSSPDTPKDGSPGNVKKAGKSPNMEFGEEIEIVAAAEEFTCERKEDFC